MTEIPCFLPEEFISADPSKVVPCRYFQIAGITIRITADLPIHDQTFEDKFSTFRVKSPGDDVVSLHHCFALPDLTGRNLGREIYRQAPWIIHQQEQSWLYHAPALRHCAFFNAEHSRGVLYNDKGAEFLQGNQDALTLLTSDQILLARLLPDRHACLIHAAGMALNGQGFLFVGHSDAGKSTMTMMLKEDGEILCDDRIVVRRWPEGFRIHGTWCHGDVPDVSAGDAPLRAILLLQQSDTNRLELIEDRREIARRLPLFVIRPLVTADWWIKVLAVLESVTEEVPVYILHFDKSGRVREVLKQLSQER